MKIRRAVIEDAEAIYRLNQIGLGYDYPIEKTRVKLEKALSDPAQLVLVAECDGAVAGCIHLQDYDTLYFEPMKNILGLAVLPEYRRQGIATALLKAADQWAEETGAAGIRLVSGVSREGAHACYRRNGYQETHLQKNLRKLF